jgi:hypothetical protein
VRILGLVTNSSNPGPGAAVEREGKRERLVAAAKQMLHEHGVERTTLADIAAAADVPLGNVYNYFKTKDALVAAVIDTSAMSCGVAGPFGSNYWGNAVHIVTTARWRRGSPGPGDWCGTGPAIR